MQRIKLNNKAFRDLRTSDAVQADLAERAQRIADAAGDGYEVGDGEVARNRARASVVAVTEQARADNARNNTLLRALDAGRG
jgi:hypothetical protein